MKRIVIRKAKQRDCKSIRALIKKYATDELMLPKSYGGLITMLPNFFVAESNGKIIGCCGFKIYPDESVEIISLAVEHIFKGAGIGSKLAVECVKAARKLGLKKIFTLTMRPNIFLRIGFQETDKKDLPNKIWDECIFCFKNVGEPGSAECPETAMKKFL